MTQHKKIKAGRGTEIRKIMIISYLQLMFNLSPINLQKSLGIFFRQSPIKIKSI